MSALVQQADSISFRSLEVTLLCQMVESASVKIKEKDIFKTLKHIVVCK